MKGERDVLCFLGMFMFWYEKHAKYNTCKIEFFLTNVKLQFRRTEYFIYD